MKSSEEQSSQSEPQASAGQDALDTISILQARQRELETERDEAIAAREEAEAFWPKWALDIKAQLEEVGCEFDPFDEIHLPATLSDWIAGFEHECDRWKARAQAAETRQRELEEALRGARGHIVALYASISRGDAEAAERFALGEPSVQRIDAALLSPPTLEA